MQKKQVFNLFSKIGYKGKPEDLAESSLDDLAWCYAKLKPLSKGDPIKKANIGLILQAIHNYIMSDKELYYLALPDIYPYQESGNYGDSPFDIEAPSIWLFSNHDTAVATAAEINKTMGKTHKSWADNEVVVAIPLGIYEELTYTDTLAQYGTEYIVIGNDIDGYISRISVHTLQLDSEIETADKIDRISPRTRALLGFAYQSSLEGRTLKERTKYKREAVFEAARFDIGIAVDAESMRSGDFVPMLTHIDDTDYIDMFTDWASLQTAYDKKAEDSGIDIVWGNWDSIDKEHMPICINRSIALSADEAHDLCIFTEKGRIACNYIANQYKIDTSTKLGLDELKSIFFDIHDAEPVWREFRQGLSSEPILDEEGNETGDYNAVFDFPPLNLIVHDVSAKQCVESGLCTNPAAAYHVIAQLYNDKDGAAATAFDNAELYE